MISLIFIKPGPLVSFAQGALDGGLDIPHNEKRLVGYDRSSKKFDAEVMKKYIFGGHVAEYMEEMEEEEPEKYTRHFSKFHEMDIGGGELEDLFTEVRALHSGWGFCIGKRAHLLCMPLRLRREQA